MADVGHGRHPPILSVLNIATDLARNFPHLPISSVGTASGLDCSSMGGEGEDREGPLE